MQIEITTPFDSPRYGRLTAGQELTVSAEDGRAFIRDGRAKQAEAVAAPAKSTKATRSKP